MGAQIVKLGLPVLEKAMFAGSSSASRGLVQTGRSFGEILQNTLASKDGKKIDGKSVASDVLALLATGMPLSMIVNDVSSRLADKIASALAAKANGAIDTIAKNKLVQAFASALAPPGGSPPGSSSAEIAAALADRLQSLVANLAGDERQEAGQQSRFSGQILDAEQAKEIPAQQANGKAASTDASIWSFVDSILKDVLAKLAPSAVANATPVPTIEGPLVTPRFVESPAVPQIVAPLVTPHDASGSRHVESADASPAGTNAQAGSVLGRIIARAIVTDARLNSGSQSSAIAAPLGKTLAASQAQSHVQTQPAQSAPQTTAADARAALVNLVAAVTASAKNGAGNNAFADTGGGFASAFGLRTLAQFGTAKAATGAFAEGSTFAAQANALLGGWTLGSSTPTGPALALAQPAPYTTIDANSVIDQVVKGFVIRTIGENQSEVRMRLSPEHLGDVALKLSVAGGNISASITAQNADVRDTLLANQSQLSKALSDAGLKLANFSVDVSGGGPNGSSQQQQLAQQAGARRAGISRIGSTDEEEPQSDGLAAVPNFGPPVANGGGRIPGLFNYLA